MERTSTEDQQVQGEPVGQSAEKSDQELVYACDKGEVKAVIANAGERCACHVSGSVNEAVHGRNPKEARCGAHALPGDAKNANYTE
jgi:hypothetical protein